jgi:predicted RNA binding protein YcfA (HicA-like mRNA interferase family)
MKFWKKRVTSEKNRSGKLPNGFVLSAIRLWPRRDYFMPKFAPVDWRTLERIFLSAGFRFQRQEGSHRSYVNPGVPRPVVIPAYREIPVFIIRNNLKTANQSRDDYFRLLEACR